MKKRLLNHDEIIDLIGMMRDAFQHIDRLRAAYQLAELIQYPKVPPVLSESFVANLINSRKILEDLSGSATLGSMNEADVMLRSDDFKELRIEVKASAKQGFSEFVEKDISADILVWVHFGDVFLTNSSCIEVHLVRNPNEFFNHRTKMTLANFKRIVGGVLESTEHSVDSL